MFLLDSIPDRICGFNAWNRRTQNTFKAFYALNSTNSRKQYVHSILLHFSFCFIPYRECKDSDLIRHIQRFYTLIFRQLAYILKYIISGVWERLCTLLSQETVRVWRQLPHTPSPCAWASIQPNREHLARLCLSDPLTEYKSVCREHNSPWLLDVVPEYNRSRVAC